MERTVIVVEDSRTQRERIQLLLEGEGYRVEVAADGREALERIQAASPDLVISDVVMPRMDGYELCRALKGSARTRRIPFVLLTERRSALDIIKGLEAGADNFITKPFEDEYLLARLERIFEGLELRRRGQLEVEVTIRLGEREITISTDKQQIMELLFANFEELCRLNEELRRAQQAVAEHARHLEAEVAARTQELRSLFDEVPVGLLRSTPEGRILDANPAALQMLGYPDRAALLAADARELHADPEERHRFQARLEAEGLVQGYETRFRRGDGVPFWARLNVRVARDAEGRTASYEGALEEVTERKRAEEAVQLLQSMTRAIGEAESLDSAFRAVLREVCHATGWSYGEAWFPSPDRTGLLRHSLFHNGVESLERFTAAAEGMVLAPGAGLPGRAWASREPAWVRDVSADADFLRAAAARDAGLKAGMVVPVLAADEVVAVMVFFAFETREEDGRLVQLVSGAAAQLGPVVRRWQAEQALRQSEKLAAMGSLLAGVAHELNNPLSVLKGQAELLQQAARTTPFAARAEKISRAADRCTRIIRNFLALARQAPPERRQLALNQVVHDAVELLAYQLRVDNVTVSLELGDDLPALWGDPNQLHQVLVNLLTNASHALQQVTGSRQIRIATRSDPAEAQAHLEVTDTGPGIPPELQGRIFEPFFTTKRAGEGTGLGLSLCKGIVEEHGGTIRVESRPGHGTTFGVALPVRAPAVAEPEGQAVPTGLASRGWSILVVDDELGVAELLAEMLTAENHQVDTATSGAEALERLRERTYDVILSDMKMPGLDGPGLYREVERQDPGLSRRFVFLTGDVLSPETRAFLEETGAPTLAKPLDFDEVERVIQRTAAARD